jgi:hypothetical protein
MTRQGIWVHIIGKAKGEALQFGDKQPHFVFLRDKAKKVPIPKFAYHYDDFKTVHENYYTWRDKQRKKHKPL